MPARPSGTVTFLFTDIVGSTRLWQHQPDAMSAALALHHGLLRQAIEAHHGYIFQIIGDAFCAAFSTASDSLHAALAAQRALLNQAWGDVAGLRVRMALHTGAVQVNAGDFTSGEYASGLTLSRAARLLSAGHGGQILLSLPTHELVADHLPAGLTLRDLGLHRMKGLSHPEHLYQVVAPDLPGTFPPPITLNTARNNLPLLSTKFVGREREAADIQQLLAKARLVTLTGSGGCGKTRLALHSAAETQSRFDHGVWLVELAPLAEAPQLDRLVASVLNVPADPSRPLLETLNDYLREKSLLLVLDNCEHLIEACARLAEALLRECPRLHLLATSREALEVPGEAAYRVPSLSLPEAAHTVSVERLLRSEAVQLFADRAAHALTGFAVTEANAAAVTQVCWQLDGVPLALELAAARVPVLRVEQIAARLDDRFRLLTGGRRTVLPRHQTLRAAIDWSYQLLSVPERSVLLRAAVFAGGWTLEAAEAVCAGGVVAAGEVLDTLTSLARKSVVVIDREPGQEARYRLLETMRQYALERLQESGEERTARDRHLAFFLALAETAEPQVYRADQAYWWARLATELDNARSALDWSIGHRHAPLLGLRLAGALFRFWVERDLLAEGVAWLEQGLATHNASPSDDTPESLRALGMAFSRCAYVVMVSGNYSRAAALAETGLGLCRQYGSQEDQALAAIVKAWTTWTLLDLDRAEALFRDALVLSQAAGHRWYTAVVHFQLAGIAFHRDEYNQAVKQWEIALTICREVGDYLGVAQTLRGLGGVAAARGDYDQAQALFEESLVRFRDLGMHGSAATVLDLLGQAVGHQGDYVQARRYLEEAHAWYLQMGLRARRDSAINLFMQGNLARREGNYPRAMALLTESLVFALKDGDEEFQADIRRSQAAVARAEGDYARAAARMRESLLALRGFAWNKWGAAENLRQMALLCAARSQPEPAARLFATAESIRLTIGSIIAPADQAEHDSAVAAVQQALGEGAFAAAWRAGAALTIEQATDDALAASEP